MSPKLRTVHCVSECLGCAHLDYGTYGSDMAQGRVLCPLLICGNHKDNGVPLVGMSPAQEYFGLPPFEGQFSSGWDMGAPGGALEVWLWGNSAKDDDCS